MTYDSAVRTFDWSSAGIEDVGVWTFELTAFSTLVPTVRQTFKTMTLTV